MIGLRSFQSVSILSWSGTGNDGSWSPQLVASAFSSYNTLYYKLKLLLHGRNPTLIKLRVVLKFSCDQHQRKIPVRGRNGISVRVVLILEQLEHWSGLLFYISGIWYQDTCCLVDLEVALSSWSSRLVQHQVKLQTSKSVCDMNAWTHLTSLETISK